MPDLNMWLWVWSWNRMVTGPLNLQFSNSSLSLSLSLSCVRNFVYSYIVTSSDRGGTPLPLIEKGFGKHALFIRTSELSALDLRVL